MKAVVYKGPFDVAVEQVPDPRIEEPLDAIIRITTSNICGSDLHPYEGRARVGCTCGGTPLPGGSNVSNAKLDSLAAFME